MTTKHLLSLFLLAISLVCQAHDGGNFVASDLFASLRPGDKAALLMVHFGTTHDDTRALTIDAINQKAKETFKDVEIREAWTSRIVMRRMKARGVEKLNPVEALEKLKADGYTHILIQSTNIIEGIEMESLRKDAAAMRPSFKEIRIGNPLLYTPEDYEAVIAAITRKGAKEGATLLVGHDLHPGDSPVCHVGLYAERERFQALFGRDYRRLPLFRHGGSADKGQRYEESLADAIYVCSRRPREKRHRRRLEGGAGKERL